LKFHQLEPKGTNNLVYIIADEGTKEAVVIDPSGRIKAIMEVLEKWGVTLKYIVHTHGHGDHTGGTGSLLSSTGAKLVTHPGSHLNPDIAVRNNERLILGDTEMVFIYTPGHSYDSMCIVAEKYLFTGDTLFIDECGYAEQVGGDSYLLWDSLFNRIMKLDERIDGHPQEPEEYQLYPEGEDQRGVQGLHAVAFMMSLAAIIVSSFDIS